MTRQSRTRAVSLTCGILTVSAVLVNVLTDQHYLAIALALLAFGVLIGYILGVS